jgi:hypothetical protein
MGAQKSGKKIGTKNLGKKLSKKFAPKHWAKKFAPKIGQKSGAKKCCFFVDRFFLLYFRSGRPPRGRIGYPKKSGV